MNFNRTSAALASVIALITIGIGVFFFSNGSGSTAPAAPSTEQAITVKAKDTNGAALNGVAVQVNGTGNTKVASGTITTGGQLSLSFDPKPGTYVVTATEPAGYRARDDKDGGASNNAGLTCSNVYLCIYLTATETQDASGTKSIVVTLAHVRPEQVSELDDLWFEMTPPGAAEEETVVEVDESDESLIGEPGRDVLVGSGANDDLLGEPVDEDEANDEATTDEPVDEVALDEVIAVGLRQVCINTQHQEVVDQNSASGIWVKGNVDGVDDGWIFVEGPTINNGNPVQIPVSNGVFDAPLGINSYGDHAVELFEVQSTDPSTTPTDLIPTLNMGPGTIFPVDSNEGPLFDTECFDFDPPAATDVEQETAPEPTADEQAAQALTEAQAEVEMFLNGFVEDHTTTDTAGLLDTLHPAIPLAFGEDTCSEYVERTAGSITGVTVLSVELPQSIDMDTTNGPITFTDTTPFVAEFSLIDGTTMRSDANLAQHDGESHWLTRCGVGG